MSHTGGGGVHTCRTCSRCTTQTTREGHIESEPAPHQVCSVYDTHCVRMACQHRTAVWGACAPCTIHTLRVRMERSKYRAYPLPSYPSRSPQICRFRTEKCQFRTEKCLLYTEKCQFLVPTPTDSPPNCYQCGKRSLKPPRSKNNSVRTAASVLESYLHTGDQ